MKKNIYKILATALTLTLVMASPMTSITSHAGGFNPSAHDDTDYGMRPSDYGSGGNISDYENGGSTGSSSVDSGSSNSTSESSTPAPAPKAEDSGSSYGGGLGFNPDAHDDTDYGTRPSDYGTVSSYSEPDSAESETVQSVASADVESAMENGNGKNSITTISSDEDGKLVHDGLTYTLSDDCALYKIYHEGKYMASFTVTGNKGNKVAIKSIMLKEDERGHCDMDITVGKSVKTPIVNITNVGRQDTYSLSKTIGVNTVTVNGVKVPLKVTINGVNVPIAINK